MAVPTPSSGREWLDKISRWLALHPHGVLTLAVLAALGPFLAKPFNIDDPLFIWTAGQIQAHPGDPFGFTVNWYGIVEPMWNATANPPLASYYLALAGGMFGWSEVALHSAFLPFALAVIGGVYRLARHFSARPALAALATLFTPVFLVSSTTVMCDVMMLAFWVWAVTLWVEGLEGDEWSRLAGAGLLMALAVLTKYFGVCLIPLLAVYGLMKKRRGGRWAASLLIPLATLAAYQWITRSLYGHALLTEATDYAKYAKGFPGGAGLNSILTALTFTGGCLAAALCFAPLLWRTRVLAAFAGGTVLTIIAGSLGGFLLKNYSWLEGPTRARVVLQIILWTTGGVTVLALALADVVGRRDARSWLLALWVAGTLLFATFFNWTINGRSLLPLAPAVGILIARRLEQKIPADRILWPWRVMICLAASAGLALLVTRSDFLLATAVRRSAQQVWAKYGTAGKTLWYQGHWGFQYYMNELGATAQDLKKSRPAAGDKLALPLNNTSLEPPPPETASTAEVVIVHGPRWLTTWSGGAGAGFYAATRGPLPFALNHVPPEDVVIYDYLPAVRNK
jgi:4-amino-4-deoxy-L-arabinose transferase-like glycosyltransferase